MRILFVHSGNIYGGVESMLTTFARTRSLCRSLEPHFALCFDGRLRQELATAGVPLDDLGQVRIRQPLSVRRARNSFSKVLNRTSFDAVICQSSWSQVLFGPVVKEAGIPLVTWVHGIPDHDGWLEQWARRTPPDMAICNSKFTAEIFHKLSPAVQTEVIYCPVAEPAQSFSKSNRARVRRDLQTAQDSVLIIQASRMEPWKGHQTLLDALGSLRNSASWTCWIVGGPQRPNEVGYMNELKARAQERGIADRVRFTGQHSHVERLLAAADIFCQPNIGPEPFGIAFVEALHAGLPVVTTAMGGAREIVTERCGVLVQPKDAPRLAHELRRLIEDAKLRRQLGAAGPFRARLLCDPIQQAIRLEQLLSTLSRQEKAA